MHSPTRAGKERRGVTGYGPLAQNAFDVVIAEQVLEHVLWPYRAVRNAYAMLKAGGWFVVCTPFLVRVHAHPTDCSRWTEPA